MSVAFEAFASLLRARSGLLLTRDRHELLVHRLMPIARRCGLASLDALADALAGPSGETIAAEVTEAMASADTAFFRDRVPFAAFRDIMVPRLMALRTGTRRLRVWSAGCSTGQEPCSLAMILAECAPRLAGWQVDLVATDLSERFLARARTGLFSQFEVQRGLPVRLLLEHFARAGDSWRLSETVRERVSFVRANLLEDAPEGGFDVVFCRNVLPGIWPDLRTAVFERILATLAPDGYLVLGADEARFASDQSLVPLSAHAGVFRRLGPALRLVAG